MATKVSCECVCVFMCVCVARYLKLKSERDEFGFDFLYFWVFFKLTLCGRVEKEEEQRKEQVVGKLFLY